MRSNWIFEHQASNRWSYSSLHAQTHIGCVSHTHVSYLIHLVHVTIASPAWSLRVDVYSNHSLPYILKIWQQQCKQVKPNSYTTDLILLLHPAGFALSLLATCDRTVGGVFLNLGEEWMGGRRGKGHSQENASGFVKYKSEKCLTLMKKKKWKYT